MSRRGRRRDEASAPETPPTLLARLWEQFGTLALAIALALAIRAFVIEPYRIPSGSMLPTLLIGDHLFVNKFIYGVKLPFTDVRLPALREPERGDVVVFTVARSAHGEIVPADRIPNNGNRRYVHDRFVKRIVGVPGDTVEVIEDRLYVNGEPVPTRTTDEKFPDEHGRKLLLAHQTLDEREFSVLDDPTRRGPQRRRLLIEDGRYFMMGDNRDWSNDSRNWGTVRLADLKGPAFVLYWSWDWNGTWLALANPLTWWDLLVHKMRWDRIGDGIP